MPDGYYTPKTKIQRKTGPEIKAAKAAQKAEKATSASSKKQKSKAAPKSSAPETSAKD